MTLAIILCVSPVLCSRSFQMARQKRNYHVIACVAALLLCGAFMGNVGPLPVSADDTPAEVRYIGAGAARQTGKRRWACPCLPNVAVILF